jgi:hypothetical protein
MPRVLITKTTAPGSYPTAGVTVTFQAAAPASDEHFVLEGNDLLIARNTHVSDPFTVTITSQPNSRNRSRSITAESLATGVYKIYGPFTEREGWSAAGYLQLEASDASIEFAVIKTGG